jgi:hypothetical protein
VNLTPALRWTIERPLGHARACKKIGGLNGTTIQTADLSEIRL